MLRRISCPLFISFGLLGGSDGKELACDGGYPGSIPGLGKSPVEGKGYALQHSGLQDSIHEPYSPWGPRVGHDGATSLSLWRGLSLWPQL